MTDRERALEIFRAGVAAADPFRAVETHLDRVTDTPALIVSVGKAAIKMTQAALARFEGVPTIVVTNPENAQDLAGASVYAAAHPVPDAAGAAAAEAVIAALQSVTGPVLALISGGGSALLPAPAGDISLDDKAALNRLLLGAGMDIRAMNLVRQQVSRLKGGGLVRMAAPQPVTALILSDVVGDDLSAIASGPTVAPIGSPAQAAECLRAAGIWKAAPATVRDWLQTAPAPKPVPAATNILIGANTLSVAAMAKAAGDCTVLPDPVEGDVADAAVAICDAAGPGTTLWGGETTVVLRGTGRGGRNQELALRIALEARRRGWDRWTCLQAGSDGRDGPVDAAGGILDQDTLARIADAGGDIEALLANNDSYAALKLADDLLMTGGTGTNVADLGVLMRG